MLPEPVLLASLRIVCPTWHRQAACSRKCLRDDSDARVACGTDIAWRSPHRLQWATSPAADCMLRSGQSRPHGDLAGQRTLGAGSARGVLQYPAQPIEWCICVTAG